MCHFWFLSLIFGLLLQRDVAAGVGCPPPALLHSGCMVLPTGGPGVHPDLVPTPNMGHSSWAKHWWHGPSPWFGLHGPHEQLSISEGVWLCPLSPLHAKRAVHGLMQNGGQNGGRGLHHPVPALLGLPWGFWDSDQSTGMGWEGVLPGAALCVQEGWFCLCNYALQAECGALQPREHYRVCLQKEGE